MHRLQSDSDSSDDSIEFLPPRMKSTVSSSKGRREAPEMLADVSRLRDDFNELYEKDFPRLQRCIEKLHNIIIRFQKDFRRATKGTRDGGAVELAGSVSLAAGIAGIVGIAFAPFTAGVSVAVAGAVVATGTGALTVTGGLIYGGIKSFEKKRKMRQLIQEIEAERKEFQNIINPMSEKMKDINERIEKLLKDACNVSGYSASTSQRHNISREHIIALTAQMSTTMSLIGTIAAIFPDARHFLGLRSVLENTRVLDDMDYLATRPINEQIDESKIKTKAGKFFVGMRKVVHQLQDIMEEIKKTKDAIAHF